MVPLVCLLSIQLAVGSGLGRFVSLLMCSGAGSPADPELPIYLCVHLRPNRWLSCSPWAGPPTQQQRRKHGLTRRWWGPGGQATAGRPQRAGMCPASPSHRLPCEQYSGMLGAGAGASSMQGGTSVIALTGWW